ncbi:MAG: hypothetical protein Q8M06_02050 [Methanobacteriaceae archaeon]|nr:hypothetical protein [Methanobacteriaceae archaeon]MDZ4172110.1 hypothetical protein [Methanobacteriaceae archaeon]
MINEQIISPKMVGTLIDIPDSQPNTAFQIIFRTAISTITDNPKNKLRFQKAAPKAINESGTIKESKSLRGPQSPVK